MGNNERLIICTCFPSFSQVKMIFFFNINCACKAIDVDTRREVVIKTWKTSANNRYCSISHEPTAQPTALYLLKCQMNNFQN